MPPLLDRDSASRDTASRDTAPPVGPPPSPPPPRASDDDRLATVRSLQDAIARGLLTPDEGSSRMATAFAAVHVQDLGPLTADLPPVPAPAGPPGWRPLATMTLEQLRSSFLDRATGALRRGRVAVVVLLAALMLLALGLVAGAHVADASDGHGWDGHGWHDDGDGHGWDDD
jgi:hypothetical protein